MIKSFNSEKRNGPGKVSGLIRDGVQVLQSGASDLETACCTYAFIYVAIRTGILISIYYSFSIGLTFYQKWLIKRFHYPLTVVICHLLVKFVLAALIRSCLEIWSGRPRVMLSWSLYAKKIAVTGIASGLDIGFSNWSFEFITISLYTMTKSTSIIFILIFSILLGLERLRIVLLVVVVLISGGLFLFTFESTQFSMEGFLMALFASLTSGVRWSYAQMVMQKESLGLGNPLDMVFHIQPWMILCLLPFAITFEGMPLAFSPQGFSYGNMVDAWHTFWTVLIGAVIAFMMEISEFLVVSYTSGLSLSVAGIFKEIVTLALAVVFNDNELNLLNFMGLVICLLGIILHVIMKAISGTGSKEHPPAETLEIPLLHAFSEDEEDNLLFQRSQHR